MNRQERLVCRPHFCPYLCSRDCASPLSLRPGSLRAWIFLLGSSCAPGQQVHLMMGNYACGMSIMEEKHSRAAVYHFWRLSVSLIRGFLCYCRFIPTRSTPHNSINEILSMKYCGQCIPNSLYKNYFSMKQQIALLFCEETIWQGRKGKPVLPNLRVSHVRSSRADL